MLHIDTDELVYPGGAPHYSLQVMCRRVLGFRVLPPVPPEVRSSHARQHVQGVWPGMKHPFAERTSAGRGARGNNSGTALVWRTRY